MRNSNPTKMICTLGPASSTSATVGRLIEAGMDVARLNFSHGTQESILSLAELVRAAAESQGRHVGLLGDLQGPKIRTGFLRKGQPVNLEEGAEFTITTEEVAGSAERVSTTYASLPHDLSPGDVVLLDDGLISLEVLHTDDTDVVTRVTAGGVLDEHKGINLPNVPISSPSLTEKDREDLEFALDHDFDYLALSFVRSVDDVRELRNLINQRRGRLGVIAKIEKPEALEHIDAIVNEADAIMVARGDLGVEMPPEQVPLIQKRIMSLCARVRKPVIIATQMLDSMREHPRPTRAEASDVANAVFADTDVVMLSGETAIGEYPVTSALMMQRICAAAEEEHMADGHLRTSYADSAFISAPDALARSAAEVAQAIGAALVAFTQSGSTARLLSMCRTRVPIFAATPLVSTARRCSLYWGVQPVLIAPVQDTDEMISNVSETMKNMGVVSPGDVIVIMAGTPIGISGTTNTVKLQTIK
jgi:pyruvate kinase